MIIHLNFQEEDEENGGEEGATGMMTHILFKFIQSDVPLQIIIIYY